MLKQCNNSEITEKSHLYTPPPFFSPVRVPPMQQVKQPSYLTTNCFRDHWPLPCSAWTHHHLHPHHLGQIHPCLLGLVTGFFFHHWCHSLLWCLVLHSRGYHGHFPSIQCFSFSVGYALQMWWKQQEQQIMSRSKSRSINRKRTFCFTAEKRLVWKDDYQLWYKMAFTMVSV